MSLSKPSQAGPLLQGILPLERNHLGTDILAGVTLAALAIPEVMGYTRSAGTPVVTGLYTILIPMALYAQGIRLGFAEVSSEVQVRLDRYQLTDLLGKDAFFETIAGVVDAYRQVELGAVPAPSPEPV